MIYIYWVISAIIVLAVLSYQDWKNNCLVDSRFNYLMIGMTLSLVAVMQRDLFYCLELGVAVFLMVLMLWDSKLFGAGDLEAFAWIYTGWGLIGFMNLASFFLISTVMGMFYIMGKNWFNKKDPSMYFPLILTAFMINAWTFGYF